MFTFMLNWEDEHTGELNGAEIFVDETGDWRGYNNRNLVYYLWEQDVYCYELGSEEPIKAESIGIFSHMERL